MSLLAPFFLAPAAFVPAVLRSASRVQRCACMTAIASDSSYAAVCAVAEAAGRAAAVVVRERVGADVVKTKASRGDLLTEVDGDVQDIIEAEVRAAFPSHAFLGEESVPAGSKASAEALQ